MTGQARLGQEIGYCVQSLLAAQDGKERHLSYYTSGWAEEFTDAVLCCGRAVRVNFAIPQLVGVGEGCADHQPYEPGTRL